MRILFQGHELGMATITTSQSIHELILRLLRYKPHLERSSNSLLIIGVNKSGKPVCLDTCTLLSALAAPADVFRVAVQEGAYSIILGRNTAADSLEQSKDDREMADFLVQAGDLLGIPVSDYLTFSRQEYSSFADSGLLKELRASSRHKIVFMHELALDRRFSELLDLVRLCKRQAKEFEEKGRKVGLAQGRKQGALEVACRMVLYEELSLDFVREVTGVSKRRLNRLKFPKPARI